MSGSRRWRVAGKFCFGLAFIAAGCNHFLHAPFYVRIMPGYLPFPLALVYISGLVEGGLGALLLTRWQRPAAWGVIALLVAVFPANVQMALHPALYPEFAPALLWARLPFQSLLIAWAYAYT
jgi:uncharacterized membrane protein